MKEIQNYKGQMCKLMNQGVQNKVIKRTNMYNIGELGSEN